MPVTNAALGCRLTFLPPKNKIVETRGAYFHAIGGIEKNPNCVFGKTVCSYGRMGRPAKRSQLIRDGKRPPVAGGLWDR